MQKMINFHDAIKENIKEHNPNWPEVPDHPYRILLVGGSGSGKTNSLFNIISQQTDISHDEFVSINNVVKEYKEMKEEIKNLKT